METDSKLSKGKRIKKIKVIKVVDNDSRASHPWTQYGVVRQRREGLKPIFRNVQLI